MEPESRYTLIGAIVLALLGLLLFSFVWLTGASSGADYNYYKVYFERQSLEGLQIGGDVNMRGIRMGRVESYEIQRDNINRVSVVIRVDASTPVSTNSVAVIDRNLVTSIADINLETPGTPGPALVEKPSGEPYPIITEGTGELDAIAESANSLIVKADEALKNINQILSADNQAAFGQILAGISTATAKLDERLESFDLAAGAFRQTAQQISRSMSDVTKRVNPLAREAQTAMGDMRAALRDISKAAQSMQGSTNGLIQRATDAADIGVNEMRATAQELRQGVDMLARTLDRLQDPRAALLGPGEQQLGPGETQ